MTDRIPLDIQINLQFGRTARWLETDAALVDLSLDGMQIRCDRMPNMSHRTMLLIQHMFLGECVALGSPVRYSGGGFGVRFQHLNDVMQQMVADLHHMRSHRGTYLLGATTRLQVNVFGRGTSIIH